VTLSIKYLAQNRSDLLAQVALSIFALAIFIAISRRFHQDAISYFFVILIAILHNLGLYETYPLGIRFDHYMHFLGGLAVAIVIDRMYQESLPRSKRFVLLLLSALGVGAVVEISQWIDGYLLPGITLFQADDMSNSMEDMIFNGFGGIVIGMFVVLRKTATK